MLRQALEGGRSSLLEESLMKVLQEMDLGGDEGYGDEAYEDGGFARVRD